MPKLSIRIPKYAFGALGGIVAALAAHAADESMFSLSGYGTLGAVYHDRAGVEFRRDMSQHYGAKGGSVSFAPDSMLAVQLTARPSQQWEAAVQLVSHNAVTYDWRPETSWAYVKYMPSDDVSLRAGRLGADTFLQGDSTEIGFANLPVRQALHFYPRSYNGADVEWRLPAGSGSVRLKGMAGHLVGWPTTPGQPPYDVNGSRIVGGLAEYSHGGWSARIATGRLVYKNQFDPAAHALLVSALAAVPNGAEIMSTLNMKDRPLRYYALDLVYDSGPVRGSLSFTRTTSYKWAEIDQVNAILGYRVGALTPYLGYHYAYSDKSTVPTGIPWGLSAPTDALNQALETAQGHFKRNDRNFFLGVRYDLSRTWALKFQTDWIRYRDPFQIYDPVQLSERYANRAKHNLTLYSAALEFVF